MSANDRAPSSQFYWKDWLTDDAVERMTFDERGRYMQVLAKTHQTDQPGVCSEEDVRSWAGYSETDWPEHREAIRRAFKMRSDGTWIQKRTVEDRAAQRRRYERSERGGRASAARPRDARGRLVRRSDPGVEPELDAGLGPPSSSPSSASSMMKQPTPEARAVPASQEPATPKGAEKVPRGLESIGDVLARSNNPEAPRGENHLSRVFSPRFLEAQRVRFPQVDVYVVAAQICEELASGTVKDPKAVLVYRCKKASGEPPSGRAPGATA